MEYNALFYKDIQIFWALGVDPQFGEFGGWGRCAVVRAFCGEIAGRARNDSISRYLTVLFVQLDVCGVVYRAFVAFEVYRDLVV